jgi:hypothetical protein
MSKAYHIVQWNTLYETANSRKVVTLTYYQKPNKLVGEGIGATLAHPQNVALLGTWSLIEALASTAPAGKRGWLVRGGTALTAARMANLTRVDQAHFQLALEHFSQPEIGWLELAECVGLSGESPAILPQEVEKAPPCVGLSGESPAILPQEEGRSEKRELRRGEKREAHAHEVIVPSVDDVRAKAALRGIDPDYYEKKWRDTEGVHGWEKNGRLINWDLIWSGYWTRDGKKFLAAKKNGGAADSRTPQQARFEISRELEEIEGRLDAAHETNVRPDAADKAREKILRQELKALGESVQT